MSDKVKELQEGVEWVRPISWTQEDEDARLDRLAQRKEELAAKAAEGSRQAALRILNERRRLWYEMQPADVQRRILLRRAARKLSLEHKKHRRQMIHLAGFLNWSQTAQVQWLATAITHFLKQVVD